MEKFTGRAVVKDCAAECGPRDGDAAGILFRLRGLCNGLSSLTARLESIKSRVGCASPPTCDEKRSPAEPNDICALLCDCESLLGTADRISRDVCNGIGE